MFQSAGAPKSNYKDEKIVNDESDIIENFESNVGSSNVPPMKMYS